MPAVSPLCDSQWAVPTPALPLESAEVLTASQVAEFRQGGGYLVLDGILPPEIVAAARSEIVGLFPDASPDNPLPPWAGQGNMISKSRPQQFLFYPFEAGPVANAVTVHPRILRMCAQLLGTRDMRIQQSELWYVLALPLALACPAPSPDP